MIRLTNRTTRRLATGLAATTLVALGAGCSSENLAERIIENRVEAESGEDIDLDLSDGNFSVKTEDGEFSMNVDDDGNVVINGTGEDGDVQINSDADGNMVIESPDGTAVVNVDDDGNFQATTEDGEFSMQTGTDIPPEFPSDIAIPAGFTATTSSVMGNATENIVSVGFESAASVADASAALAASVENAGYTRDSRTETPDAHYLQFSKGEQVLTLAITANSSTGGTDAFVQIVNGG